MSEPTIREALMGVIEKHLPSSRGPNGAGNSRSDMYSRFLVMADVHDSASFGVSHDVEGLEDLERFLSRAMAVVKELSPVGRTRLNSELGWYYPENDCPLADLVLAMDIGKRGVANLRKRELFRKKASKRRNWRAASVADEARRVWGLEEFNANPELYGGPIKNELQILTLPSETATVERNRLRKYEEFVENYAPTSDNHYRPGPFGRFLEDVFETLGIVTDEGGAVTAATALDALKKIRSQEKR
ncbi:hypothetical protein LCM08_00470 [Salipiger pacificus]|nr:hypothetical protein [Alloyangia pacifica]